MFFFWFLSIFDWFLERTRAEQRFLYPANKKFFCYFCREWKVKYSQTKDFDQASRYRPVENFKTKKKQKITEMV
jgi:hypothetical protein